MNASGGDLHLAPAGCGPSTIVANASAQRGAIVGGVEGPLGRLGDRPHDLELVVDVVEQAQALADAVPDSIWPARSSTGDEQAYAVARPDAGVVDAEPRARPWPRPGRPVTRA